MAGRELIFVAEAENGNNYWVYKKGSSFYISGPNGYEHLCHPSVTSHEKILSEILLVFNTKVVNVKLPSQLNT